MKTVHSCMEKLVKGSLTVLPIAMVLLGPWALKAQRHAAEHGDMSRKEPQTLEERVSVLQDKVAVLESVLKRGHQAGTAPETAHPGGMGMDADSAQSKPRSPSMSGMGGMEMGGKMMGGMGMGDKMMGGMGMGDKMMGGMGMGGKMMGGKMMGGMDMAGANNVSSAEPGQPGASHLLHIGSTGFFLDHPDHITLSRQQQLQLNRIREAWQLESAAMQRDIEQAEQDVWAATATGEPDSAEIKAAVEKAEKLRTEQRLAFVRAVMEATGVLTNEQKDALLGMVPKAN